MCAKFEQEPSLGVPLTFRFPDDLRLQRVFESDTPTKVGWLVLAVP